MQRAVRLAQQVMCVLYVAVALIGVLFTPPWVMLTVVPVIGLIAAGLLAWLFHCCELRPLDRRTLMVTGQVAAALVPFHEGVQLLQGFGTAIALTVLVLLVIVGSDRLKDVNVRPPTGATGTGDASSYVDLLRVMPLELVFSEWRALERGGSVLPGEPRGPDVVQVRALLLDEMQRRDPVGFGRWLHDGAVDDPEQHIQGDHGLAA